MDALQRQLSNERSLLRTLIDNLPDGIYAKDLEGRKVIANSADLELLGCKTEDEVIGKTDFDFYPREIVEAFLADDVTVMKTGKPVVNREEKAILPNGETRWLLTTKVPWRDTSGKIIGLVGIGLNITDQVKAEIKLKEERNLLRALIDNLPDGIYVKDAEARKILVNPADLKNLGCMSESEALGKTDFDIYPKDVAAKFFADDQSVIKEGKPVINREEKVVLPDGEIRWLLTSKIPWRDASGNTIGLVGIGRDITDKKNLEAEVLRAQHMESLARLATGIAHDLNNTLAPVLISIELLRQKLEDSDSLHVLAAIEASAKRAAETAKQVLSFSRQTEGRQISVNIGSFAEGVISIVSQSLTQDIRIETRIAQDLWPVLGNPLQLHQVLLNLCTNAVEAMLNGGRLTLTMNNFNMDEQFAGLHNGAKAGPNVLVEVSDTGDGIATELRERIFEPFFTTKELGTKNVGIGLSTTLSIVKGHHGIILVKSEVGKGSTFQVYLPAQQDSEKTQP